MPCREKRLEGRARLENSLRRHAGLGHAQVQRHLRPLGGETPVHFHHLGRIGVLQRHAVAREAEPVEQIAVFQGAFEHRPQRIVARSSPLAWPDRPTRSSRRPATHSRAGRPRRPGSGPCPAKGGSARDGTDGPDCSGSCRPAGRPRPPAGSFPEDRRRDWPRCGGGFRPGPRNRVCVSTAIRTTPAPACGQLLDLRGGRLDVGGLRGAHALHHDRMPAADRDRADLHRPGGIAAGRDGGCVGECHVRERRVLLPVHFPTDQSHV